jgi:hypothetical protein
MPAPDSPLPSTPSEALPATSRAPGTTVLWLIAVAGVVLARLSVLGREVFDGSVVRVPVREPDVLYHLKRVAGVAGVGPEGPGVLWRDPSLNAPCDCLPPWPWGFDGALGLFVRLAGLASPPEGFDDVFLWASAALLLCTAAGLYALYRSLGALGLGGAAGLLGLVAASADPVFSGVTYFGKIDNQVADLGAFVLVLATLTSGLHRRRPGLAAALWVGALAFSDVALLLAAIASGLAVLTGFGRVPEVPRRFVLGLAGGSALFLLAERASGLTRSYSSLVVPLVACFGLAALFAALQASARRPTARVQVLLLVPAAAIALAFAYASGGDHLLRFFAGGDAVVGTISEGLPGYVASAPHTVVLLVLAVPLAMRAVHRAGLGRFERWTCGGLFLAGLGLFIAQVKFRYLADGTAAVGAAELARLVLSAARPAIRETIGGLSAVASAIALTPFHLALLPAETTGETRAVHALAATLRARAEATGTPCAVVTLPDYGTALNLLGGCRVSASTFWGDACSAEGFRRTTAACRGDLGEALRLHDEAGFRTLLVEISDAEAAGLQRSPLAPLEAVRYASTKFGEPRTLVAFDLPQNREVISKMLEARKGR